MLTAQTPASTCLTCQQHGGRISRNDGRSGFWDRSNTRRPKQPRDLGCGNPVVRSLPMHEGIAPKTTVGNVLKQFRNWVRPVGLVARPGDEPFTLIVVNIPYGHTWKYRSQRSIEANASPRCVSPPFPTSVPCTEIRRNTWHKWHNFCTRNRVRNAGSAFHSTKVLIPKHPHADAHAPDEGVQSAVSRNLTAISADSDGEGVRCAGQRAEIGERSRSR